MSELGELATLWTVRLAVGCYLGRVFADVTGWANDDRGRAALRIEWTFGAVLLAIHVVLAFETYHDWSHAAAYAHTAERTAAATGWRWGGGLYLNHLMTAWWLIDAALWWWYGLGWPERSPAYTRTLHAYFAFMTINATVVFGPRGWWWVAGVFAAVFVGSIGRRAPRLVE